MNTVSITDKLRVQQVIDYASSEDCEMCCLIAMIRSLTDSQICLLSQEAPNTTNLSSLVQNLMQNKEKKEITFPKYMPEGSLVVAFCTPGKKIKTRLEIRSRMENLSYEVQGCLLNLMLDGNKTDRKWALRYVYFHEDKRFIDKVMLVFEKYKEKESAKYICKFGDVNYIEKHLSDLADAYHYVAARVRLPKDAPIDYGRITNADYLYLAAKLHLDISEERAQAILIDELLNVYNHRDIQRFYVHYYGGHNFNIMIWSLGQLKFYDTILWYINFTRHEKDLYEQEQLSRIYDELLEYKDKHNLTRQWDPSPTRIGKDI